MSNFIKQVLLRFIESLAIKYFLNDDPCMISPALPDMNPVDLKYYDENSCKFMITLNECTGSCIVLSPKICAPKKTKYIDVKAFNIITNKDETKAMTEHILRDCKCKFNVQHVIQNKDEIIKHVNENVKIIVSAKMIIVEIQEHVFVRTVSI